MTTDFDSKLKPKIQFIVNSGTIWKPFKCHSLNLVTHNLTFEQFHS